MDASKDARLAHADSHACETSVELVKDVAFLGTVSTNNCALSSRVDKSLDWVAIDRSIDVEHGDVAKELRVVLERVLVVSLDHLFPDLLLNHLLRLGVVRICISETYLPLLLGLLLVHDFFEAIANNLLNHVIVVSFKSLVQGLIAILQSPLEVRVGQVHLLKLACLLTDTHPLRIVDHLIRQLLLGETRALAAATGAGKESIKEVLLLGVQLRDAHVDHVPVVDPQLIELGLVALKQLLAEEQFLLLHVDLRLHGDEALQVLNRAVGFALDIEELVVEAEVLDHQSDHRLSSVDHVQIY